MKERKIIVTSNKPIKSSSDFSIEVRKNLLHQFAENQNHHQRLFIQFLSSMLFVLAAYGFVYTNTSSYKGNPTIADRIQIERTVFPNKSDSLYFNQNVDSINVRPFDTIKNSNGNIISYGIIHLVSIYLFAQVVLCVLAIILLHLGYSFRRDQVIVNKIREQGLGTAQYEYLFNNNFKGTGKNIINYLPNFYSILYLGMFIAQAIICISIFVYLNDFPKGEIFIHSIMNNDVSYIKLKYFLLSPLVMTSFFYIYYFNKYNNKIRNASLLKSLSIVKVTNRIVLKIITISSFAVATVKIILYFNTYSIASLTSAIIDLANGLSCWISLYLKIKGDGISSVESRAGIAMRNLLHSVFFFVGSIFSFVIATFVHIKSNLQISNLPDIMITSIILLAIFSVLTLIKNVNGVPKSEASAIGKQIEYEIYMLILILFFSFFILLLKIKFLDMILSYIFSVAALLFAISRFSTFTSLYLHKEEERFPLKGNY